MDHIHDFDRDAQITSGRAGAEIAPATGLGFLNLNFISQFIPSCLHTILL